MLTNNNTLVLDGETLSINDLIFAGKHPEVQITVSEANWPRIQDSRNLVDKWAGEERCIYGVNTSCGGLVDHLLPKKSLAEFQKNLLRCVTTQVGALFSDELVRIFMIARANSLCRGYSGIKPENLKIYIDMINKGVYPCIPKKGSLGASGDLGPLGCIACVAIGEWKARYKGKIITGKEAMSAANVLIMKLHAKEGLSLINGTSAMTGLAADVIAMAVATIKNSDIIASLSIETLLGRIDPFDPRVHLQKYHPGQYATAKNLTTLLNGSSMALDEHKLSEGLSNLLKKHHDVSIADIPVEDAYSIRCTPQIVGPSREVVKYAMTVIERELNSTNDNPLIFTEDETFIHNGNFHGQVISLAMDIVGTGMITIGVVSDRRIDRFMDKSNSVGLPPFLCREKTGIRMGLMGGQFMTSSLVAENRTLAIPASIQSVPSTADFQDVVSMGLLAGRQVRNIVENTNYILSFELMCAAQAADIRGTEKLSPAGRILYDAVRETVPYFDFDTVIIDYLEELADKIQGGVFVQRIEEYIDEELMLVHEPDVEEV